MNGRRKTRTLVSLVARYRSPTVFEFVEEPCFDLSEGGMFIKSRAPAPTGTLLKIECTVGDGPQQIAAVARVVWLRETDAEDGPRGMGVKFVKLETGSPDVIRDVLSRASASLPPPASPSTAPPSSVASASEPPTPAKEPASAAEPAATPKPATSASAPTTAPATPRPTSDAQGTPMVAWVVAAAVIIAIVVFATRSKPTEPPASAIAPMRVDTPAPERPATPPVAPTPPPAPAPEPLAATPEPLAVAPEAAAIPEATPQAPPEPVEPATPQPIAAVPAPEPPVPAAAATPAPTPSVAAAVPAATAGLPFVVNVVSTPKGAQITADAQRCTAPCTLRFVDLASPVKVTAEAAGYRITAATIDANAGFAERDSAMHKTLYLKLNPDPAAARPAPAREAPESAAPAEAE